MVFGTEFHTEVALQFTEAAGSEKALHWLMAGVYFLARCKVHEGISRCCALTEALHYYLQDRPCSAFHCIS